jgi:hypothetical protein
MFKKITTIALMWVALMSSMTFGYSSNDINNANYLANQDIIKDWSTNPVMYKLDSYASRSTVIALLLTMKKTTINDTCRGDFSDIPRNTSDQEWVCRIIETAADYGYINAMTNLPTNMKKVRPNDHVTHSEAVGILMKAFDDTGAWAWYSYYWDSNLPNDGDSIGYKDAYNFGATWQAAIMYSYVRKVLQNDLALRSDPLVNETAQLKEVYDFAREIMA